MLKSSASSVSTVATIVTPDRYTIKNKFSSEFKNSYEPMVTPIDSIVQHYYVEVKTFLQTIFYYFFIYIPIISETKTQEKESSRSKKLGKKNVQR